MKNKADYILRTLKKLYPHPKAPLDHTDEFTLLIAVLLSARNTDVRVNIVTPALFKSANTPQKMAKLPVSVIQEHIKTCGLAPTKAKNIKKLSEILVKKYKGKVPRTFEELEELPGVGHKTASVVMAQAFRVPAFPVDTHIHRLAKRWGLSDGKNVVKTEEDLKKTFPKETWNDLQLQIIFYGREYCTARGCDGKTCMICKAINT